VVINNADLAVFFQALNSLGVVGILGFLVVAFYRGELVAKSMLDRILAVYEKQLANLTERILERLDSALGSDVQKGRKTLD